MKKIYTAIDTRSQLLLIALVLIDLYAKYWAILHLQSHPIPCLPGWLDLQLAFNRGTAFSLLSQASIYWKHALTCLNAVTIVGLCWWLFRYHDHTHMKRWALILLIAGGCGNFFNRWLHQYVVDFIAFSFNGHGLFICNIADIYITFGLLMLIYDHYITHD